jgi:hypothetical protein
MGISYQAVFPGPGRYYLLTETLDASEIKIDISQSYNLAGSQVILLGAEAEARQL